MDISFSNRTPWLDKKVAFFRLLAVTQKAGLWIRDSLWSILSWELDPWMKKIIAYLIAETNKWNSLADAMGQLSYFFNTAEIALVKSSESMWNLPEVLQNLADELESFQKTMSKIKWAMIYPTFVILIAIGAIVILLIKVIPTMVEMFPDKESLPRITTFTLDLSDFLQKSWHLLLIWFFWIIFSYVYSYKYIPWFKKFMDKLFLTLPHLWNLTKKFNLYRFTKMMWDFYNAWVSPTESLSQMWEIFGNYYYKQKLNNIRKDLQIGLWFVDSMEWSWLFDPILIQIIWIWEETWNIWELLLKMSLFYKDELDVSIEWMMKLIEPALMAIIAVIVWFIVAAVFLPMAELMWTIW